MALEQQKINSPEDLARRLESKSCYYLASRVRVIGSQVHINSRDWISVLRSQMGEFENNKLTEALGGELLECKPGDGIAFQQQTPANDNIFNPENEKVKLLSYFGLNSESSKELSKNLGEVGLNLFQMLSSYKKFIEKYLGLLDSEIKRKIVRSISIKVGLIGQKLTELRNKEYDKHGTLRDFKNNRWIINSEIKDLFSDVSNKVLPSALALVKGNGDTKKLNKAREMFSSGLTDDGDFDKTWTSFEVYDSIANSWEVFELSDDADYFRNMGVSIDDFDVNLLSKKDKEIEDTAISFYMAGYWVMILNDVATLTTGFWAIPGAIAGGAYYGVDAFNSEDSMISLGKALGVIDGNFRMEKQWYKNVISGIGAIPLIGQGMRIATKSATFTRYVESLSPEKLAMFNSMKAQIAEYFTKFYSSSENVDNAGKSAKLSGGLFKDFGKNFDKVFSNKLGNLKDGESFNIGELSITKVGRNKFEFVENGVKTIFSKKELLAKLDTTSIEARQLFLVEEKYLQNGMILVNARVNNLGLTTEEISDIEIGGSFVRKFLVNGEEVTATLGKVDSGRITITQITKSDGTILKSFDAVRFIENSSFKLITEAEEVIKGLSFFESRFIFSRIKDLKESETIKIGDLAFTKTREGKFLTQMEGHKVELTFKQLKEYVGNLSDVEKRLVLLDFKKAKILDAHRLTKVITNGHEVTIGEDNAFKVRNVKTGVLLEGEDLERFIDTRIGLLSRRFYGLGIEGGRVLVREGIIKGYEKMGMKTVWDYLAKAGYVEGDKSKFFGKGSRKLDYLGGIVLRPATTIRQLVEAIPARDLDEIFRIIVSGRKEIPILGNPNLNLFPRIGSSGLFKTGALALGFAGFEYAKTRFTQEGFSFGEYLQEVAFFKYGGFLYPIITQAVT